MSEKATGGKIIKDPELQAMGSIDAALQKLTPDQFDRVWAWLEAKYNPDMTDGSEE